MRRVALITAFRDGMLLLGKRTDNGRWTLPGGHLIDGEDPAEGALRELKEETNLVPASELKLVDEREQDGVKLYVFECEVDGAPTGKNDPDEECRIYAFFDVDDGIPKAIAENMAGPKDPDVNVATTLLGLAKAGGYDENGWPLRAPRGFVSPTGDFHPVGDEDHHDWVMKFTGAADSNAADANYGNLLKQGWMAVGVSGGHNVNADPEHIKNPNHPATQVVRALAKKHWGPQFELMHPGGDYQKCDTAAFAHGGRIAPPNPFRKDENGVLPAPTEAATPAPVKARRQKKVSKPAEANLIGIHNLSHENLVHAHELGGLVAPSLAITHKDHPLEGFGDVSLVANHHLIDPEQVPVFDADIYSPRHPRAKHRVDEKGMKGFRKWIEPHAKAVDAYVGDIDGEINRNGPDALKSGRARRAMGHAFLHEKGVKLETPMREKKLMFKWAAMPAMQEFKAKHGHNINADADGDYHQAFSDAARKAIAQHVDQELAHDTSLDQDDRKAILDSHHDNAFADETGTGNVNFSRFHRMMDDMRDAGQQEPDTDALGEVVDEELKKHPDFEPWLQAKAKGLVSGHYLPKYVDHHLNGPSERKIPYTPGNILKEMTRSVRSGEGFNYGLGNARAKGAKRFRSLADMAANRHRIVPKAEFEKHRDANNEVFNGLATELQRYHADSSGFRTMDALVDALGESFKRGRPLYQELKACGFSNVPPELQQRLAAFGQKLLQTPTEYFEAKPQRVVNLNEFKGAAVPTDAPEHTLKILRDNGIHHVEKYDRNMPESRAAAIKRIAEAQNLLLAEMPMTKAEPPLALNHQGYRIVAEPGVKDYTLVRAYSPDNEHVGTAELYHHPEGHLVSDQVWVHENHPGQGIATAMYGAASQHSGMDIHPSNMQTGAGEMFWAGQKIKKAEDDEIERLLLHPNPAERSMALKLEGVKGKHLVRALSDEDPELQRQAVSHPALDEGALFSLMKMPERKDLAVAALDHPAIQPEHLHSLYETHWNQPAAEISDLLHALSHHQLLDAPLIEKMVALGHGGEVIDNLHTPAHVLEHIVNEHFEAPDDLDKKANARRALCHEAMPKYLVDQSFRYGPLDVRYAIAMSPNLPEPLAYDLMMGGQFPVHDDEAMIRAAVMANPVASNRCLDTGAKDRNRLVRTVAASRLGKMQKFEGDRSAWLSTHLAKAIVPQDFSRVKGQIHVEGPDYVDHRSEPEAHPPANNHDVQAYRNHVLNSKDQINTEKEHSLGGITAKVVYKLPASHMSHPGHQFMIKPYHEKFHFGKRAPIHGWAEMTTQALFHAGGIGHLHQGVHVSEHDMGGYTPDPAVVIHMDPDMIPVAEAPKVSRERAGEDVKHDARRIAVMDFLTHNTDRHHGNLLVDRSAPDASPRRLLAIDHGLNFQYRSRKSTGSLGYFNNDATKEFAPFHDYNSSIAKPDTTVRDWKPVMDWWSLHSGQIRKAMDDRLQLIKKPEVRAYVSRNFRERADWLDRMAHQGLENQPREWYKHGVKGHDLEDFLPPKVAPK